MEGMLRDLIEKAEALLAALTYDDSGMMGRGGNGGLISRETIRKGDALRKAVATAKRRMESVAELQREET